MTEQAPVIFSTHEVTAGGHLAHAQLNLPKSLNALNLEMVQLLFTQLTAWQSDESINMVVLSGVGEKAFCAGGDVVSLHNAMRDEPSVTPESVKAFFSEEYELDYLIHTFAKPIVCWGKGIIMGGGIGLFAGASHRVVTETTRLAMPEITIGLFPDVGGSYFLNKVPDNLGLFLGLTGVQVNGADAIRLNMATHQIAGYQVEDFIERVAKSDIDSASVVDSVLAELKDAPRVDVPVGNIDAHDELLRNIVSGNDFQLIYDNLIGLTDSDEKWLSRAGKTLRSGSPITAHLVFQQLKRARDLSLLGCFKMELIMACKCASFGEFQEGVRALLIDKDGAPNWKFADVASVPEHVIDSFFTADWSNDHHPLSHIEE